MEKLKKELGWNKSDRQINAPPPKKEQFSPDADVFQELLQLFPVVCVAFLLGVIEMTQTSIFRGSWLGLGLIMSVELKT